MKKLPLLLLAMQPVCSFAQNILWQKTYGGSGSDICYAIQQTTDGGYIQAGLTASTSGDVTANHGGEDVWLVKTDGSGIIQWQKTFGGAGDENANAVLQTADGGYIMAGVTSSTDGDVTTNHGSNDFWVIKTDASGTLVWQKTYGGTAQEYAESIQPTADGGYIITGTTGSGDGDVVGYHGSNDIWVVKIDASGTLQWQKCLGDTHIDEGYKTMQTADGGYMVAGYSSVNGGDITGNHGGNDFWVVKLNSTGTLVWQKSLGGSGEDRAYSMDITTDGGCIVAGYTVSSDGDITAAHGFHDCWIVKVSSTGSMEWQKSIGGSMDEHVYDIHQTTDGGYILATASASSDGDLPGFLYNYDNYFIIKLNASGAIVWKKVLGGQLFDVPHAIQPTSDGNYIIAGGSMSSGDDVTGNHGSYDFWVVKLSPPTTDVNNAIASSCIFVYPNPASTSLSIAGHTGQVTVYDMLGRQLITTSVNNPGVVDISTLPEGTYLAKLVTDANKEVTTVTFTKK